MEAELMALAAAGATALVQQMATDSWSSARGRVAAFLSRRARDGAAADEETVEGELEVSRGELAEARDAGDEQVAADVESEWRTRLRRTLAADPAAAAELRSLLDELAEGAAGVREGDVHNTISGGVQYGPVVQARSVGSLNFGAAVRPGPEA
ncbi:hypothetical protein [Streptomyces spiramyceticus]|uniref:hypothetical protein n=1 Tax=Streptomyces spiramyceticus TaxID=299717 RepID=UPI00237BD418|nr:hypothetical protein [Streptomyces spiramyceticus]